MSGSGVRIAVAPPGFTDWKGLFELLRSAYAYMDGRIDPPSSLLRMDPASLEAKSRGETLIAAFDDGRLVGCAFAALHDESVYVGKLAASSRSASRRIRGSGGRRASRCARRSRADAREERGRERLPPADARRRGA